MSLIIFIDLLLSVGLLFTNCWYYWLFTSSFTSGCFDQSRSKESSSSLALYQSTSPHIDQYFSSNYDLF